MPTVAQPKNMRAIHEAPETLVGGASNVEEHEKQSPFQYARTEIDSEDPTTWGKIARNDLCPCGSGKKFKHCHGKF